MTKRKKRSAVSPSRCAARRLKLFRKQAGLSPVEMDQAVGFENGKTILLEIGHDTLSLSNLVRICRVLKKEPNDFFNEEDYAPHKHEHDEEVSETGAVSDWKLR